MFEFDDCNPLDVDFANVCNGKLFDEPRCAWLIDWLEIADCKWCDNR